jgi:hypothetical protein
MKIQVSHGAGLGFGDESPDWFIVEPLPGDVRHGITNEMAVESLRRAGRSVYELDVVPWGGRVPRPRQPEPDGKP